MKPYECHPFLKHWVSNLVLEIFSLNQTYRLFQIVRTFAFNEWNNRQREICTWLLTNYRKALKVIDQGGYAIDH